VDTDLETLATALYVTADDLLKAHRDALSPGGMGRLRVTSASHSRFF